MPAFTLGKKKENGALQPPAPMNAGAGVPLDQVKTMQQQGMADNQIIQTLQRDGFSSSQIFDAMSQSDLAPGSPQPLDDVPVFNAQQDNYQDEFMPPAQQSPPPMAPQQPFNTFQAPVSQEVPMASEGSERMEEIAEAIIEEKWDEFMRSVNKIIAWKEKTEARISAMEQRVNDMKQSFDSLNKNILGKIDGYDKDIKNVGAEIKAMERVFQQILPSFTDSVNELSRITKNLKKS
jgi:hypothetical protein